MTYNEECIHNLVSHSDANLDLCAQVYNIIENADSIERYSLFIQFITEFKYTSTDLSWSNPPHFQDAHRKYLLEKVRPLYQTIISSAKEKHGANVANRKIWQQISDNVTHDGDTRIVLLYYCAMDKNLPFVDTDKIAISSSEQLKEQLDLMNPVLVGLVSHIAELGMEKVSDDASLYVPLLDKCKSERERAALLTLMFIRFRDKALESPLRALLGNEDE